ncbi:spermatogenesis-associated protein 7 homolog isoform X3 [Neolamprologus brichardi]|uniref:spermatogenesis-associated protein 7 homolog isoform X3 n=1 Tax=Neolamprologus brichardi TaxID=32507 RepID=UPI0003EBC207|nr:spermatogenesis-associated protein 7 homolog isoform X3 [Neolamprologus brichardi]
MDSRIGSVSSGLGYSPGVRAKALKSSPFCPLSSSKLTQSIIKDHMVSHYKKVYSAKAAIDTSVPKSLLCSVKYNDQIKRDRLRKNGRPQSAPAQRNSRTSYSSSQSRLSVQYDDSTYLCSRSSLVSSPRFNTTFKVSEMVYPSLKVSSHHTRPASELKYRSPEAAFQRKSSACSLAASGDQSSYKTFQDPVRKTYSGDLLLKHSQHFTQDKPFTPKTLKSDKSSYLSKYRYYRAPQRKLTQDCSNSTSFQQEMCDGSIKNKDCMLDVDEPSQGFITEHEWFEDELNGTYSSSRQKSRAAKGRERGFFDSLSRVSPENRKSPNMMRVSTENREEELMYLEFISAVTEDILSRGHISDRVLDRVLNRHIDMNRHQLDEGKMRHLLEVLCKDFEEPTNISSSTAELEKKNYLLDSLLPCLESVGRHVKTKEDNDLFPYVSPIKHCDFPAYTDPLLASTSLHSPTRTPSQTEITEKDKKGDSEGKFIDSSLVNEHVTDNTTASEEDFHIVGTTVTTSVHSETQENSSIASDQEQADGQSNELEDLGKSLSESLHVSSNTHCKSAASEQHSNTGDSGSDDEF